MGCHAWGMNEKSDSLLINDVGCSLLLSIGEFADEQISLSVDGS
jgi:hypothetical protein